MNILICDDKKMDRISCSKSLAKLAKKHQIDLAIDFANSGEQLLNFIKARMDKVDLIYLDIHMENIDGIEASKKLRQYGYKSDIVFYTIDENHWIDAFDVAALHYVVKNKTKDDKFEKIFLRAVERVSKRHSEVLLLRCAGENVRIPISEIAYFEVKNRIVTVHYDGNSFEFYSTLSKIEEMLYGKGFIRTHVSFLVSKNKIHKITKTGIILTTKEKVPASRSFLSKYKKKNLFDVSESIH